MNFLNLTSFLTIWQKNKKESLSLQSDLLHLERRHEFHKNVPGLEEIKEKCGVKFNKLQQIFNEFDPVYGGFTLQEFPNKYEMLTRTLIYRLPKKKTQQGVADLIDLEFSMWFKHEYGNYERKEELAEAVLLFKNKELREDPFREEV